MAIISDSLLVGKSGGSYHVVSNLVDQCMSGESRSVMKLGAFPSVSDGACPSSKWMMIFDVELVAADR